MKPTKIAYEKRYSDNSGVEFAVRLNATEIEFKSINTINFPVEELDWLIESLMNIRGLIAEPGKGMSAEG